MFISTLILIPWIIFGLRNPDKKFLRLNQTGKSIIALLIIETLYFITLLLLLDKPDPDVAGQGSFAWTYMFFYEKGIFPTFSLAESINGHWGDLIDRNYKGLYFMTALTMDYIVLWLTSPRRYKKKKAHTANIG